ncbi:RNA-directed DNA polymerase, eukaryota [Tanacetum coccineum]|uniref:RNA-directed DNA polymerase, eukaryota n=1 Tax=Tanacetum coccineum TaxID=301880 RepID=A0ABQ4XTG3_9ASTR
MGKQSFTTDDKGWTWIFNSKKNPISKPINNPYQKDLERVASSFYVSNLPDSLDAKRLWNAWVSYGRLVDAYIANKRSIRGKRFGFILFLCIKDESEFVRSLSNIWIGSFHFYVSVARYQRKNQTGTQPNHHAPVMNSNSKNYQNPNDVPSQTSIPPITKPSFASVHHPKKATPAVTPPAIPVRTTSLKDQDLITIEDSSTVILLKVKDVESMGNMYVICKNAELGYALCAWGSNAFKKVASLFGKFVFFEAEDSIAMSAGRMSIATKSHKHVSEKVLVEVHGEHFEVHVQEISTWSVNIFENSRDTSSNIDVNEVVKDAEVANSVEDDSIDDLNDLNENLNNSDHDFKDMENLENAFSVQLDTLMKEENFAQHETQKEEEVCNVNKPNIIDDTSDVSKPLGFEHFKRSPSHSSKCSTSFARHHKKDIKGVSLIHELNRIIKVRNALGYDVK